MSTSGSDLETQDESTEEDTAEMEEDVTEEDRHKIRQQLSTMSFEDLQKLKNDMGSKVYSQTVFGIKKPKTQTNFKRVNKNRPREMSSKKMIKINNVISAKKVAARDPRFDPMCGSFDRKTFKQNYKFVNDIRKKEKKQLEAELAETINVDQKKKIKFVVQRLDNQIREDEKFDKEKQQEIVEKLEIREKLKSGEKVTYKKKSVRRLESLINKYEELKKTNKLQKHIEKRSKKLSVKERRKLEKQKLIP